MLGFRQLFRRLMPKPDLNSIRFRLTAGVVLASALGVGTMAGWLNWQLQKKLLLSHQAAVSTLSQRFKDDVALYTDMMTTEEAVQKVIDLRALGDTAIWVDAPDGDLVAHSETMAMGSWQSGGFTDFLHALSSQKRVEIQEFREHSFAICVSPLRIDGELIGTLFVAEDVTQAQQTYAAMTRSLLIISGGTIILLAGAIALYVHRSLRPIKALSSQVMDVTADSLSATQLELEKAPTEVKELAHALEHTLERLGQSWEQQRRLVGDVSHELRTPLTVIQGYLQSTLRRCDTLTEPQRNGLETAASETDRTIQILNDLLVLARASMEHLKLTGEKLDLKNIILDAVMLADPAGDRVEVEIEVAPLWVRADANALRQVLMNLMDNALNYSDPNQPVVVRLSRREQQAVIEVCDHGRGIPLTDQTSIFEPFYRVDVDRSRATGGTGLGLAIVKALLSKMQGTVSVRSALGVGSTFIVQIPTCQGV